MSQNKGTKLTDYEIGKKTCLTRAVPHWIRKKKHIHPLT